MIIHSNKSKQKLNHTRSWQVLALGFAMATAVGSRPARGADACSIGELVDLVDPVVTVLDGPADAATEQAEWSARGEALLDGPFYIGLGEHIFDLEPLP